MKESGRLPVFVFYRESNKLLKSKEIFTNSIDGGPPVAVAGTAKDRQIAQRVFDLVVPVCTTEGMELIQVAYQRESSGRVLRLYIDKPGGVTLEDCAGISRQVDDLLEVNLDDMGPYGLEVSSPGVERPLVRVGDFEKFKDRRARIQMASPMDGRKAFTGILLGMTEGRVLLHVDNRTVSLPYNGIAKAHLVAGLVD